MLAVKVGSNAHNAGIRTGELIKEINHKSSETMAEFKNQVSGVSKGDTMQLLIHRANAGFIAVKMTR